MGDNEPAPNPYEGPQSTETLPVARRPGPLAWGLITLVAIPAFAIGFFFSCLGTLLVVETLGGRLGESIWIFSFLGGFAGIAFVIWIGRRIIQIQHKRADVLDEVARERRNES